MNGSGPKRRVERHVSAGGVVYGLVNGEIKLVLCGFKNPPIWCLPKGTPDGGETLEETALREVREETGLEVAMEAPIGSVNYWFVSSGNGANCNKTVHFYLMAHKGGSTDLHDTEFDVVQWFSPDEALKNVAYVNEAKLLEKALGMIREKVSK